MRSKPGHQGRHITHASVKTKRVPLRWTACASCFLTKSLANVGARTLMDSFMLHGPGLIAERHHHRGGGPGLSPRQSRTPRARPYGTKVSVPANWDDRNNDTLKIRFSSSAVGGCFGKFTTISSIAIGRSGILHPSSVPYRSALFPPAWGAGHERAAGLWAPHASCPRFSTNLKRRQIYRSPRRSVSISSDDDDHCVFFLFSRAPWEI